MKAMLECSVFVAQLTYLPFEQHDESLDTYTLSQLRLKALVKTKDAEIKEIVEGKRRLYRTSSVLGTIELDEGANAPPIAQQIANHLRANTARVLDL